MKDRADKRLVWGSLIIFKMYLCNISKDVLRPKEFENDSRKSFFFSPILINSKTQRGLLLTNFSPLFLNFSPCDLFLSVCLSLFLCLFVSFHYKYLGLEDRFSWLD